MSRHRFNFSAVIIFALGVLVVAACTTTSYLKVTYQRPDANTGSTGKSVFLKITDSTGKTPFVGPKAADELKQFSGLFSVYVAGDLPKPTLEGAYDISGLFEVAFRERLSAAGVTVIETAQNGVPTLKVNLTAFQIDKDGRTWKARLGYMASMHRSTTALTTQTVSGTAERAKIVGIGDAEKLLGEIVTDSVNKLDIETLFDHPEL